MKIREAISIIQTLDEGKLKTAAVLGTGLLAGLANAAPTKHHQPVHQEDHMHDNDLDEIPDRDLSPRKDYVVPPKKISTKPDIDWMPKSIPIFPSNPPRKRFRT